MAVKLDRGLHEGVNVVNVRGEIDLLTAPALKETIYELLDSGVNDIILDMTELDFMDSAGLGVLVSTLRRVRMEGTGSLSLVCDRDNILKLLSITGLDKVLDIYVSMEERKPCRK